MDAIEETLLPADSASGEGSPGEIRVLVVDDDPDIGELTGGRLEREVPAIAATHVGSGAEALDRLAVGGIDAIVSDYEMPGMDGLALLETVRAERPELPFVLYTARGSEEIASDAISAGVTDYLQRDMTDEQYELLANRVVNAVARNRARREYRRARARFRALTEDAPFAVVTIDEESVVQYTNDSIRDVLGYEPEAVIGESLVQLMPGRFEYAHREAVDRFLRTGERNLDWSWIELPGLHADGHEVPLGITFGELAEGETRLFTAIIRDISERKAVEAERELLHDTIRAAAGAETFLDGLEAVIREVCEAFDWVYGEAWVPSSDGSHLDRTEAAHVVDEAYVSFASVSSVTEFGPGEGLPGRAWERQEPVWMPNVSALTEATFPRVESATDVGLKAALGVPIVADDQVVAVLSFYMAEERERDDRLVDALTTVATELGGLMERKRRTDALAERERELERRRDELAAQRDELERLNRLNTVIRSVVEATIEAGTREEIEELVCERLVADAPFTVAWIGEVDRNRDRVRPRVSAGGAADYLEEITVTTGDEPTGRGPTGRAIESGEVQAQQRLLEDPAYEPWREAARERGFRSSAAVPIVHEERRYGVLNVYADVPDLFGDRERAVLGELGRGIGKAISASEQREALLGDAVVEVVLRSGNLGDRFAGAVDGEDPVAITVDRVVPAGSETYQFLSATGISGEVLADVLIGAEGIAEVEVLEEGEGGCRVQTTMTGRTLAEVLADSGGRIRSARYEDGEFRLAAELPYDADVREVLAAANSIYPGLELVSQRGAQRNRRSVTAFQADLESRLTDRQYTALELAYYSDFFDWPRGTTGEEVAEAMDISPTTFHQHLRTGERKLVESFFDEQPVSR